MRIVLGAGVGALASTLAGMALGHLTGQPLLLVPPVGASVALVFAVTASPLAQPRAVIGGNCLSFAVGLAVTALVPGPFPAAVIAVALAIAAMILARCLHPPGGAMAVLPVLAGPAALVHHEVPMLALVAVNSTALVLAGWAFHTLTGHSYPHRTPPLPELQPGWRGPDPHLVLHLDTDRADLLAVLDEMGDRPDISLEDLVAIVQAVEMRRSSRG